MFPYKFLVSPRHKVYLKLIDKMRPTSFYGLFEIHITVNYLPRDTEQTHFKAICKKSAVKPVLIELPSGQHPNQLMTSSFHHGSLLDTHMKAFSISQIFIREGYDIQRSKIEAMCSTTGVPLTDEDSNLMSKANYFEFHIKLELLPEQISPLQKICQTYKAHLSKNAFKTTTPATTTTNNNETHHRFVTLRLFRVGKNTALGQFDACVSALEQEGFKIVTKQREYSVYDSNVLLDIGWIN